MAKQGRSVERWVLVNNEGQYAGDAYQGCFVDEFEEAHVFVAKPQETIAVHPRKVIVSLVRGAD